MSIKRLNIKGVIKMYTYVAISDYGNSIMLKTMHPRKELLNILGYKRADKIYMDTKEGAEHIGYVIGRQWYTVYTLQSFKGA